MTDNMLLFLIFAPIACLVLVAIAALIEVNRG